MKTLKKKEQLFEKKAADWGQQNARYKARRRANTRDVDVTAVVSHLD